MKRGAAKRLSSPRARPRTRRTASRHSVPFVGLTGGIGAGKSTALEALERLGAAVLSTDAVVHELYEDPDVRDAVSRSVRRTGRSRGNGRPGRRGPGGVRHRRGPGVARGSAVAAGRRADGALARGARAPLAAAARRGGRGAAAVRVRDGRRVRRDDRGRRRRGCPCRACRRPRPRGARRSAARASSPSRKRRNVRRTWWLTTAASPSWRRSCRRSLRCLSDEPARRHDQPFPRPKPRGGPPAARDGRDDRGRRDPRRRDRARDAAVPRGRQRPRRCRCPTRT